MSDRRDPMTPLELRLAAEVWRRLDESGMTVTAFARTVGTTGSNITRSLRGSIHVNPRQLERWLTKLGYGVIVDTQPLDQVPSPPPVRTLVRRRPLFTFVDLDDEEE